MDAEMDILRILKWQIHHVTPVIMLDCISSVPDCPFAITDAVKRNFNQWLELASFGIYFVAFCNVFLCIQ